MPFVLIYFIKFKFDNVIWGMLQFYLVFDSQDCYWISWRDFQNVTKCNCLFIL